MIFPWNPQGNSSLSKPCKLQLHLIDAVFRTLILVTSHGSSLSIICLDWARKNWDIYSISIVHLYIYSISIIMGLGINQEKVWFHGILVGEVSTPLKNDGFRQLWWWNSQVNGKKHVPNHQLGISWDLTRINGNAIGFGLGIECWALGWNTLLRIS